jgi:uncharacterized membrane protein
MRLNTKGVASVGGSGELELSPAVSGNDDVGIGTGCRPEDGVAAYGWWVVGWDVCAYAVLTSDAVWLAYCAWSLAADAGRLTSDDGSLTSDARSLALVAVPVSGTGYVAHVGGGVKQYGCSSTVGWGNERAK